MRNMFLAGIAVLALTAVQPAAHAEGFCIPFLTCTTTTPTSPSTPADAPEIGGASIGTGFAMVAGLVTMVRARRRNGNR